LQYLRFRLHWHRLLAERSKFLKRATLLKNRTRRKPQKPRKGRKKRVSNPENHPIPRRNTLGKSEAAGEARSEKPCELRVVQKAPDVPCRGLPSLDMLTVGRKTAVSRVHVGTMKCQQDCARVRVGEHPESTEAYIRTYVEGDRETRTQHTDFFNNLFIRSRNSSPRRQV
jgi:hypothetical protein